MCETAGVLESKANEKTSVIGETTMGHPRCLICNKTFNLKIHLVVHLRTIHGSEVNGQKACTVLPKRNQRAAATLATSSSPTSSSAISQEEISGQNTNNKDSVERNQVNNRTRSSMGSLSSAKSRDLEKSGLKTPDAIAKYKLCSASEGSGALSISSCTEVNATSPPPVTEKLTAKNGNGKVVTCKLPTRARADSTTNGRKNSGSNSDMMIDGTDDLQKNKIANCVKKEIITRKNSEVLKKDDRINKEWGFIYHRGATSGLPDRWTCVVCNKGMNTFSSLALHLRKNHGSLRNMAVIDGGAKNLGPLVRSPLLVRREKKSWLKPWKCKKCKKSFMRHKDMWKHRMNMCGLGHKYRCPCCLAQFPQKQMLYEHRMIHNSRGQLKLKASKRTDRRGGNFQTGNSVSSCSSDTFSDTSSSSGNAATVDQNRGDMEGVRYKNELRKVFERSHTAADLLSTTNSACSSKSNEESSAVATVQNSSSPPSTTTTSSSCQPKFGCRIPGCNISLRSEIELNDHARLKHNLFPCLQCDIVMTSRLQLDHHYLKCHNSISTAISAAVRSSDDVENIVESSAVGAASESNVNEQEEVRGAPLRIKVEQPVVESLEGVEQAPITISNVTGTVPLKTTFVVKQNSVRSSNMPPSKAMRALFCGQCKVRFPNIREYLDHRRCHKDSRLPKMKQEVKSTVSASKSPVVGNEKVHPQELGSMKSQKQAAAITVPGVIMKVKKEREGDSPEKCPDCGQEFKARKSYLFHVEKSLCKKKEHPYKCNECDQSFTREASLKNHVKSQHEPPEPSGDDDNGGKEIIQQDNMNSGGPSPRLHQCHVCGKILQTLRNLNNHIAIRHSVARRVVKTERQKPKLLLERYLSLPMRSPPVRSPVVVPKRRLSPSPSPRRFDFADFVCNECGKDFDEKNALAEHLLWHNAIKNSKQLQRGLLRTGSIAQIRDDENTHKCAVCGGGFHRREDMLTHVRYIHSRKGIYGCMQCERVFQDAITLIEHQVVHNRTPPGERKVVRREEPRSHARPEKGDCYPCIYCGCKFSTLNLLYDHRKRTHPMEKSIICPYPNCCIPYVHEMGLKRHMRDHEL